MGRSLPVAPTIIITTSRRCTSSRSSGKDQPVAYALDGYPIYGLTEPDGSPVTGLDECHGHELPGVGLSLITPPWSMPM